MSLPLFTIPLFSPSLLLYHDNTELQQNLYPPSPQTTLPFKWPQFFQHFQLYDRVQITQGNLSNHCALVLGEANQQVHLNLDSHVIISLPKNAVIRISDTPVHLPMQNIPSIFAEFYSIHSRSSATFISRRWNPPTNSADPRAVKHDTISTVAS